jgi:hypothetical protein
MIQVLDTWLSCERHSTHQWEIKRIAKSAIQGDYRSQIAIYGNPMSLDEDGRVPSREHPTPVAGFCTNFRFLSLRFAGFVQARKKWCYNANHLDSWR